MKNKIFTIYHVPGVKIGCTYNLKRRLKEQGLLDTEWEVLETHTDENIASKREKELQKQYGYPLDKSVYNFETRFRVGKMGGQKNKESGVLAKAQKIGRQRVKELYSKSVLVFRKDTGEFVGEFESQKEAARQLGVHDGNIHKVIRGIATHTGGYTFQYAPKH
jgi:hypothetical protein